MGYGIDEMHLFGMGIAKQLITLMDGGKQVKKTTLVAACT
jgi:predicted ABC-class ATPase